MFVAVIHSYNIWFVEPHNDIKDVVVEAVKQAMIEDGYWEDCEMEDGEIENSSQFAYYTIPFAVDFERIKRAYRSITGLNSESEMYGSLQAFIAILNEYKG